MCGERTCGLAHSSRVSPAAQIRSPPSQGSRCPHRGQFAAQLHEQSRELSHVPPCQEDAGAAGFHLAFADFFFNNLDCEITRLHLEAAGSSEMLDFPLS